MTPTKKLEATAYHEAGHAVASFLLHRGFRRVTIIPGEGFLGQLVMTQKPRTIHPDYETDARTELWLRREIIIDLAGPVAEKLHTSRGNWKIGGSKDLHKAVDLASYIMGDPDEIGAYLDWLTLSTTNMLKRPDHWPIVQALAAELLERKVIGAKRARALMWDTLGKAVRAWAKTATEP
jgi:ATP-dependent Zn protease